MDPKVAAYVTTALICGGTLLVVGLILADPQPGPTLATGSDDPRNSDPLTIESGTESRLAPLRDVDRGFSEILLLDHLQLLHRRGWAAASSAQGWPKELGVYFSENARRELSGSVRIHGTVSHVVLAGTAIQKLWLTPSRQALKVQFLAAREESYVHGDDTTIRERMVLEEWVFVRAAGTQTQSPEATRRLGCPSCGSALQVTPLGRCTSCGTAITDHQLTWQVTSARVVESQHLRRSAIDPTPQTEASYAAPTRAQDDLEDALQRLRETEHGFNEQAFLARVERLFPAIQHHWSEQTWNDARPYVTDRLWHRFNFWMRRYQASGQRNAVDQLELLTFEIVRVDMDPWYEAVTVRLWAYCLDYTTDLHGHIIEGSDQHLRRFSEYWTFIRRVDTDGDGDPVTCPSCGANAGHIVATGVCTHCRSVVENRAFDWVVSRVEV